LKQDHAFYGVPKATPAHTGTYRTTETQGWSFEEEVAKKLEYERNRRAVMKISEISNVPTTHVTGRAVME
jgi:hypothetical protein